MTCTIHPGNYYRYRGEKCICTVHHRFSGGTAYSLVNEDCVTLFYHIIEGVDFGVTVPGATPWVDEPKPLRFSDLAVGEWFQWALDGAEGSRGFKTSEQRWTRFEEEGSTWGMPIGDNDPVRRVDPPPLKEILDANR